MSQEESHDGEQTPEHWFSHFEDECFDELEVQGRVESRLQSAEEYTAQQLWLGFQQTSTAMAQLYNFKDAAQDGYVSLIPFNRAAELLAKFYKDSLNNARECLRLGMQSGRSSRARDIAAWARKKRKCIRRDELLAYLCGKSLPSHPHHVRCRWSIERPLSRRAPHQNEIIDSGESPVMETIASQGLCGSLSNISVSYNRPSTTSGHAVSSTARSPIVDSHLNSYLEERAWSPERRKRNKSSSPADVNMECPVKRGKFL